MTGNPGWGLLGGLLYVAAIIFGVVAIISGVVFGFAVAFNNPVISGLAGAAAGLGGGSYLCYQTRQCCFMVATVAGISGLLLPWFVSLFGGGVLASIAGVLISVLVTFVGCFIGLFTVNFDNTQESWCKRKKQ